MRQSRGLAGAEGREMSDEMSDLVGECHPTQAKTVQILYRNYRGETAVRMVEPSRIWFGATDWHPEPQWVLEALDLDKGVVRSFAMRDILRFGGATL